MALCHVQCARAAGEISRICAELVHGYNRHPAWDETSCHACYCAAELESLEGIIPGIDGSARAYSDVSEIGESHPSKAGPCVKFAGLEDFVRLRARLDGCLTGCRLAKDRAAEALTKGMSAARHSHVPTPPLQRSAGVSDVHPNDPASSFPAQDDLPDPEPPSTALPCWLPLQDRGCYAYSSTTPRPIPRPDA